MEQLRQSFAALGEREFRLLWSGSLLATTAFMTTFILVPIVAYQISGSYAASGFAQMGMGFAQVILGPLGGVIADRYPKKPLVLGGQIAPCIIIIATGVLIVTDNITIPLLFASTLLMGAAFALMGPARQAWVTDLVPQRLLPNAIALQQMSINVAQVFGPTLASVLVLIFNFDAGYLYLMVACLFVIVIPLTLLLPWTRPSKRAGDWRDARRELFEGFRYLSVRPRLRVLWLFWLLMVVCGFAMQTLMPGILDREFGRSENDAVVINLVFGISALLINIPLAGMVWGQLAYPLLLGTAALMGVGMWIVAAAPTFLLVLLLASIPGAGRSGVMLVNQSILMSHTRPEYFGRVMSWVLIAFGLQAFLAPVWGGLADAIGGRETLVVVGVVIFAGAALMALGWVRTRRIPPEAGTAAAAVAGDAPSAQMPAEASEQPAPAARPAATPPQTAPSPAHSALFAARLAPVALMDPQKRQSAG